MALRRNFTGNDTFYRVLHEYWVDDGEVSPAAFQNTTGTNAMSVDWAALSTPDQTAGRFTQWGIRRIAVLVASLCWAQGQTIEHKPSRHNQSHTAIVGQKTDDIRQSLADSVQLLPQVWGI